MCCGACALVEFFVDSEAMRSIARAKPGAQFGVRWEIIDIRTADPHILEDAVGHHVQPAAISASFKSESQPLQHC